MKTEDFNELLVEKGRELYRDMPWRNDTRPYYVLVSELMLQQTQVARVLPKFEAFITAFPDEKMLASAHLSDVLKLWQGLGYNRRAKFLHDAAKAIVEHGLFPDTYNQLTQLPGIGKNTAGAILAYSFNQPSIFIETNIRTVYIHHFFSNSADIDDKQIIQKLEETLDHTHPREFYWALMDYGSSLKTLGVRNNSASRHYKKQSPLKGSLREMRGMILRELVRESLSFDELRARLRGDERFELAFTKLLKEGLITQQSKKVYLTK